MQKEYSPFIKNKAEMGARISMLKQIPVLNLPPHVTRMKCRLQQALHSGQLDLFRLECGPALTENSSEIPWMTPLYTCAVG